MTSNRILRRVRNVIVTLQDLCDRASGLAETVTRPSNTWPRVRLIGKASEQKSSTDSHQQAKRTDRNRGHPEILFAHEEGYGTDRGRNLKCGYGVGEEFHAS
jgi:hypothetical protein